MPNENKQLFLFSLAEATFLSTEFYFFPLNLKKKSEISGKTEFPSLILVFMYVCMCARVYGVSERGLLRKWMKALTIYIFDSKLSGLSTEPDLHHFRNNIRHARIASLLTSPWLLDKV